uniref:Outer-membrane lipoprotein LolB n=1 Tax=Candidatus Aschnera chinzeii TaxID=1485666 RepID=A0AAT9G530_9ENTR|nr:MAG: hypothetical protein ACHINZ_4990 [Candidatus Aschnera chinzeii]
MFRLTNYQIKGNIIYRNNNNRYYLKFFFQQYKPHEYRFILTNLFGFKELDIHITKKITKIIDRNGNQYSSIREMTKNNNLFNINIPLQMLPYWFKGIPINPLSYMINHHGLLSNIVYKNRQNIFIIKYDGYSQQDIFKLPNNIKIKYKYNVITFKIYTWILE